MPIASGTRLGPYEIVAPIGAGGMGEVYRAVDTRLDRTVAIKVLPDILAADPQFRARFDREARTLSQLTHPHICTLYDVGSHNDTGYLVMELLSGETLAVRLERGALPLAEALSTAVQIADALDAAHRAGIVHRDLKPANVICTRDGAKLLDFGLAKGRADGQGVVTGMTATVSGATPLTGQGSILGTLPYMSPEQVEGLEADARSDVFAFGAILYEMITGRRAFQGNSPASLIGAILKEHPRPAAILPALPPEVERIVTICLAKDPDERWQSMGDLKRELQWVATTPMRSSAFDDRAPLARAKRRALVWGLIGLLAGSIAAGLITWRFMRPPSTPRRATRLAIALPAEAPIDISTNQPAVAVAPNGTHVVYVAALGTGRVLYLRSLDQPEPRPIPGTEEGLAPFFSPDGQSIGFIAQGNLKRVPLAGGVAANICEMRHGGAVWGSDNTIVFSGTTGLMQVPAAGGIARPLTTLDARAKESQHVWPDILPDGRGVLFTAWTGGNFDDSSIVVQTPSGERRDLGLKGTFARYSPTGHIVYARAGSMMAVPFELARLRVTGAPAPILENIVVHAPSGAAEYAFSAGGALVYVAAGKRADVRMVWVDRHGTALPLAAPEQPFVFPRLSADDRRVVFGNGTAAADIWMYDINRDTMSRLTFGDSNLRPIWTADNSRVTFTSSREGPLNVFWMPADGSAAPEKLSGSEYTQFPSSWSPDGRYLGIMEIHPSTGWDLWILRRDDPGKLQPFLRTPFSEGWLEFSPDGKWVAYTSNESGRWEIYVRPFPGPGAKVQISSDGGTEALWARTGRELFYRNRDKMMVVPVNTETPFSAGKPVLLFEGRYEMGPVAGMVNYDVSRDGQRFLMLKSHRAAAPDRMEIVLEGLGALLDRTGARKN